MNIIGSTDKGSTIFSEADFPEHYQKLTTGVWEPNTGMWDFSVEGYVGVKNHRELEYSFERWKIKL